MDIRDYKYKVTAAGRVNLIGEHVDYCGGKVFPAALSLKNTVYVRENGTDFINIAWTTLPDKVSLDINKLDEYKTLRYGGYQAGSASVWKAAGHRVVGCDMIQDCTVPFGSGLSSSAAIEVSTIAALSVVAGEPLNNVEIALAAQKAEREYVGVNCGIMDQYASACGKAGSAMLLDCKTLDCEYVPVKLGDFSIVIINCNKPHNLTTSKYNERREETEIALKILQKYEDISCLAEATRQMLDKHRSEFEGKVYNRALHVAEECERVKLAESAMKSGDMKKLGKLLNASHASLKDLYEVTGFELDALAEAAQSHPACLGSRMTGGGFGGCTVSIVKTSDKSDFIEYTLKKYREKTGYEAVPYEADIADGITVGGVYDA